MYNVTNIYPNKTCLCHFKSVGKTNSFVYIEAITEEQENKIDKSHLYYGETCFIKDNNVAIKAKNIYFYGTIDFTEEECDFIEKLNLINDDHNVIYSTFNFDTSTINTENQILKRYDTWDALLWFMYNYCLIGKPERVIVYKVNKPIKIKRNAI